MASKILVVEVDQVTTRVIEMDYLSRNPKVYGFFTFSTPLETTRDGSVKPNEDFVMTFKNQYAFHNMSATQVLFLLSSSRITSRDVEIPWVPDKQIQGVLEGSFTDYFPVDPEQYHFVYKVLRKKTEDSVKTIELNLLSIPNDLTAGYFEMSHALGLQLVNICYVGNSSVILSKVMSGESVYVSPSMKSLAPIFSRFNFSFAKKKKDPESVDTPTVQEDGSLILGTDEYDSQTPVSAVVKIEAYSSFVTVINNGEAVMQRSLLSGFNELVESVKSSGEFGDDITYTDAIKVLYETELLYPTFYGARKDESRLAYLRTEVTDGLKVFIDSVSRALDYYTSRNQNTYVKKVLLTGAGAGILGIARLFQNEMSFEVEIAEQIPHLVMAGEKKPKEKMEKDKKEHDPNKPNQTVDKEPEEKVVTLDDLTAISNSFTYKDPEPEQKEEGPAPDGTEMAKLPDAPVEEVFNPSLYALLIVSALVEEGIVTEAERFGDAQAAAARKDKKIVIICVIAAAVLFAAAGGLALYSMHQYNKAVNRQEEVKKNIAEYERQGVENVFFEYSSEKSKTGALKDILASTHSANENLVAFIEELEEKIPQDTIVESLIATEQGVTINFVSGSKITAAKTLVQLRTFESVQMVTSGSLTDTDSYIEQHPDDRQVSYSVSLVYKSVPFDVDAFIEEQMNTENTQGGDN